MGAATVLTRLDTSKQLQSISSQLPLSMQTIVNGQSQSSLELRSRWEIDTTVERKWSIMFENFRATRFVWDRVEVRHVVPQGGFHFDDTSICIYPYMMTRWSEAQAVH